MAKAVSTTSTKKSWIRAKWIVPMAAVLLLVIAQQSGLLALGWARLMASTFPSDSSLLAYLPNDVSGFAIVDPHQIELKALGPEEGALRSALEARVNDVKKATDIDLASDVDKLVLSPALVVGRGRFQGEKLAGRLAEYRYSTATHRGVVYLVRKDADAIAIIDDSILLYGDEEAIKRSIDAKENGTSVKNDEKVMARLDAIGWDHPVVLTVRLIDDKPSLRDMITGTSGPRAVTFGVRTIDGVEVKAAVETATPSAAEELKKTLEERRGNADALATLAGAGAGPHITKIAKEASIAVEPGSSSVIIQAHVPQAALEAVVQTLGKHESSIADSYKKFKLWELLGPASPASAPASGTASASASASASAAPAVSTAAPTGTAAPEAPASGTPAAPTTTAAPEAPATSAAPHAPPP